MKQDYIATILCRFIEQTTASKNTGVENVLRQIDWNNGAVQIDIKL